MVESRYFLTVQYVPTHADSELLAARCISEMHRFIVSNKTYLHTVGIGFPNWSISSIGRSIAFFSADKDMLVGLAFQPYFSLMINEGLFAVSSVEAVPNGLGEVRYVRNQTIGKSFVGSKKRRLNRSIQRSLMKGGEHVPVAKEDREFDFFHSIEIGSGSSGKDFVLHIQREEVVSVSDNAGFDSYGLASNQKWRGTVPDIQI